jgi:hypothetical protein
MGCNLQDSGSATAAASTIGGDFMLTVQWKKEADAESELGGFISTSDLLGVPGLVLHVSSPSPYTQVVDQLKQLALLAPRWDGHVAARVERGSVARAIGFLNELHNLYQGLVAPPMVGPLPDGGVALVWRTEKKEVEVDFVDNGSVIDSAVTDRNGERPEEFQERVGIDSLLSFFVPDHLIS